MAPNPGTLASRVLYTKQSGVKRFLFHDIARSALIRPTLSESFRRIWPVCESGDFLAKGCALPRSTGAYGTVMTSNNNTRPRAAEVLVDGAEGRLVRRRETYEDLVLQERLGI